MSVCVVIITSYRLRIVPAWLLTPKIGQMNRERYTSYRYNERKLINVTAVRRVRPRAIGACHFEGHRRRKRAGRSVSAHALGERLRQRRTRPEQITHVLYRHCSVPWVLLEVNLRLAEHPVAFEHVLDAKR